MDTFNPDWWEVTEDKRGSHKRMKASPKAILEERYNAQVAQSVKELADKEMPLGEISEHLNSAGIPTFLGAAWSARTLSGAINKAGVSLKRGPKKKASQSASQIQILPTPQKTAEILNFPANTTQHTQENT